MLKIQIKSIYGAILFEYEKENNTIKDTVEEAVKNGASLYGASLDGVNLDGASLNRANLDRASLNRASLNGASLNRANLDRASLNRASLNGASLNRASLNGANLDRASLNRANLDRASLNGASLDGASLDGVNLDGASLYGANLEDDNEKKIEIKRLSAFSGIYKYIAMPIISITNEFYVKLGYHTRLLSEWENDFWNNDVEFPNDNSLKSNLRVLAFETCKKWLELNK